MSILFQTTNPVSISYETTMDESNTIMEGTTTPSPVKGRTTEINAKIIKKFGPTRHIHHQTPSGKDEKNPFNLQHLREAVPDTNDLVYFPVDVKLDKLRDWDARTADAEVQNKEKPKGALVSVNSTDLAVFKYGDSVIATSARCPHAGGPLHLGDIEMLPDSSICVKCPWHKWAFCVGRKQESVLGEVRRNLFGRRKGAGECVFPEGREGIQVFPANVVTKDKVKIGFQNFHNDSLVGETF